MAVKLQGPARPAAVEARDDGGRGRVCGHGALDLKPFRGQEFRQAVGGGAGLACPAGNGYQPARYLHHAAGLHRLTQAGDQS